jgi:hypothetical protein
VTGFEPASDSVVSDDAHFTSENGMVSSAAMALQCSGTVGRDQSLLDTESPSAETWGQGVPPDLQSILSVWSRLKPHIKEAISTLIHASLQVDEKELENAER